MRDIFSEGLLYLDLLELYGSSYAVAEICGVAQSNVFRGANACSKLLNLGLRKDRSAGTYQIERNQDVQRDLRRLNQRLRARENGQLRLLSTAGLVPSSLPLKQSSLLRELPCSWDDHLLSLDYLEKGLIDLLIVPAAAIRERLPWPAQVRRADLYVPVAPFVASALCPWPRQFFTRADHPLQQLPVDQWDHQFPLLCTETLPELPALPPGLRLLPSSAESGTANGALHEAFNQQADVVVCGSPQQIHSLAVGDEPQSLQPLPSVSPLMDPLLLVSLPHLVPEPLHQELSTLLRRCAKEQWQTSCNDLGLKSLLDLQSA
ncbi:MAG: hypothetical protein CBC35_06375 [Planctomycetes bacterium TMED75]|nr:MAG: hypothetical protein CBC35_06375 [Planctomycetes bacterium TMED75]